MSRSYCKALTKHPEDYMGGYTWVGTSFSSRNRQSIRQELKSPDYGDIVFPIVKECLLIRRCKWLVSREEIRSKYFTEVRKILNGYWDEGYEGYIEIYNSIKKGLIPDYVLKYGFDEWAKHGRIEYVFGEWLYSKKVKRIIKNWTGEPLEVLQYLLDDGFIEEAVRQRYKVTTMK